MTTVRRQGLVRPLCVFLRSHKLRTTASAMGRSTLRVQRLLPAVGTSTSRFKSGNRYRFSQSLQVSLEAPERSRFTHTRSLVRELQVHWILQWQSWTHG